MSLEEEKEKYRKNDSKEGNEKGKKKGDGRRVIPFKSAE